MIPMFTLLSSSSSPFSSFTNDDEDGSFGSTNKADAEVALRRWAASMAYSTCRSRPDGSMVVMRLSYSDDLFMDEEWDKFSIVDRMRRI